MQRYLDNDGRLQIWPKKHADKQAVCEYVAQKFELDRFYHEREVNEVLKQWHTFSDWPLLRRELVERGLMTRNRDGTEYKRIPGLIDTWADERIRVRGIVDADYDSAIALINHAFTYQDKHKGGPRTDREQFTERVVKSPFYVFLHGDQIVGTVYVQIKGKDLHFGLLTLADYLRGSDNGKKIIAAIYALGKVLGCHAISLDYLDIAPWLKKYYESHGFHETGLREEWLDMQMIEMKRPLQ